MIYRLFTLVLAVLIYCSPAHALKMGPMSASLTTYAPSAPVSVSGAAGNGQVVVSWSAGTVDGTHSAATSFNLWRGTSSGGTSLWQSGVTSPYTDTASNGTGYYYKVEAVNSAGNTLSTVAGPYTPTAAPTAPGAPTGVTATAGNAQATVTFTAPASNGGSAITGYTVSSSPAGGTDSNAGSTSLSHVVTGLTNGTAYTFTVTATNSAGTSSASSASNSVTPSAGGGTTYDFAGTAGSAPDSSKFTVMTVGGGTAAIDSTSTMLKVSTSTATDGALAYASTVVAKTDVRTYAVRFKVVSTSDIVMSSPNGLNILAMKNDTSTPGAPGTFSYQLIPQVIVSSGSLGLNITYYNAAGTPVFWDAATNTWVTTAPGYQGLTADTWYWFELSTDATGFTYALYAAGTATSKGSVIKTAPKINWSNAYTYGSGNLRIQLGGDYLTDSTLRGTIYFDTYTEQ